MATGHRPNVVAGRIFRRLADYADVAGGIAYTDNMGFAVPELQSGRESFSPDAAYYTGPVPANPMRFIAGPPDFAAEVRSDGDFGPAAEAALRPSGPTTLRRARSSSGMSIRSPVRSRSTPPRTR